jgi:hypothetical protein
MDSFTINLSCLFRQLVIRNCKISVLSSLSAILLTFSKSMLLSFPSFAGFSIPFKEMRGEFV